ncbi:MAG: lysylphosphatidylglycerol synthase transmembrane domain-containing protein [Crocinitomicaceae bacterium]
MKKAIINFLKVGIPLAIGVYLIWYFYSIMDEDEKTALFQYVKSANYFWIFLSLVIGLLSHISRAIRWRYMVDPLGKRIGFWTSYHAIMIGYFVNLFIPRAGEATRAVVLSKTEKVPFPKLFGTIIAERAIDLFFLAIICLITIYFQYDNLDLILARLEVLDNQLAGGQIDDGWSIKSIVFIVLGIGVFVGVILMIFKPLLRKKVVDLFKGFLEGGLSIFKSKNPTAFLLHSVFIWVMYVCMFSVCFLALEETAQMPIGGILAGFVGGTIGFIVVQGGIGVYQALVALIITTYLYPEFDKPIHSVGLALGWIIWLSQNIMVMLLGLISYLINIKNVTLKKDEELNTVKA